MSAHRGSYLLYINGLAIPCPHATVTAGVGMIPECGFSLAPHPLLQRLGADDRVEVVVFFLDTHGTWRLMFEGEILGWSYSNTPLGTRMNFTAIADIYIFTQLKYHFMTASDVMGHALNPTASTDTVTQPGAYWPFSLFKKGLVYGASGAETLTPDITKPFEILYNAVRGMIDAKLHTSATGTPAAIPLVNFFTRWARKRNFHNKFTALPIFEDGDGASVFPILDSVQNVSAMEALQSGLAGAGDQGSMWDVLQQVFTTMYFELAMLPTAPAYRVRLADGYIQGLDGQVDGIDGAEKLQNPMRLMNYFVKPQTIFGIPPSCNVVFPSMLKSVEYSENYMTQPSRFYVNESFVTGLLKDDAMAGYALTFGYPEEVNAAMRAKVSGEASGDTKTVGDLMSSGRNVLVYPEEFYKGPVSENSRVPKWFTVLMTKSAATKTSDTANTQSKGLQDLFNSYVRYEYFRKRYEKRSGGAQMHFNPYIVPGFPCFIFDRAQAGMHVAGYVQTVTWSMSTNEMSTSMTYGYGRTLQEFLQTQWEESAEHGVLGAAPAEPLPTVRDIVQKADKAEEFYRGLFHGRGEARFGNDGPPAPAAALLHTLVGIQTEDGVKSVELTAKDGPGETPNIPKVNGLPNFNIDLQPLEEMHDTFFDGDHAHEYVSRPICSLDEYIRFRKGEYTTDKPDMFDKGAPYYRRIYKLRQGPAAQEPDATMTGANGTGVSPAVYTGPKNPVPNTFPQTRIDWDDILETYLEALEQTPPLT